MPDLAFRVDRAEPSLYAASPELILELSIHNRARGERIHGILLRCQVRIEAPKRAHDAAVAEKVADVFGPPREWGRTLRSLPWAQLSVAVPAFEETVTTRLPLPVSYDFSLITTKYLHALEGGEVPLALLFSGTVFHALPDAEVAASPIPWTSEVEFRLAYGVYEETMKHYYPHGVPIALERDVFERLLRFRTAGGPPTWERTILALLPDDQRPSGAGAR
jgi:hypothetical protein